MFRRTDSKLVDDRGLALPITRRDFLQGVAIGGATLSVGAAMLPAEALAERSTAGAQDVPGYYPPALTGMRGSHPGSFEVAHALRDGLALGEPEQPDEAYDLVVVGAGISGLSAAHCYRQEFPAARMLLLDNHDDFGGHAKRNEFQLNGRMHLMNGGTLAIDSPRPYSSIADGVLRAIGIDAAALAKKIQYPSFYRKLGMGFGVFFDKETFGSDYLASGYQSLPWSIFLKDVPLSMEQKADVERVENGDIDYFSSWTLVQKKEYLRTISYAAYLEKIVKISPIVLALYQNRTHGEWAVGADAVSALDAWGIGMPGFKGLKLDPRSIPGMGFTPAGYTDTGGSTRLHFPDGNATIARMLVRSLIPEALPAHDIHDAICARAAYSKLDVSVSPVRLRLNSTVIKVQHIGDPNRATATEVTYVRAGKTHRVRARHCVLACYNAMIPYLCPELPEAQKAALRLLVKAPLVYTSVAIRSWSAFAKLKVHEIHAPGGYFSSMRLNPTVDIGAYHSTRSPDDPNLIWMTRTPCQPGLPEYEQNAAGRAELMQTPFEVFEREVRAQLGRTLAGGGFDPATDITAITVNRWPHGYAPEYNSLFDPLYNDTNAPHVLGRVRFGRIAIANSDAGAGAYTDVAIEQGHRAVQDLRNA